MTDTSTKIDTIIRQTDYTVEQVKEKLEQFDNDELAVIRNYIGIKPKPNTKQPIPSINQAIYQQIRGHLDGAMKGYRERVDKGEAKKII